MKSGPGCGGGQLVGLGPNLALLSHVRRNVARSKAHNAFLVEREVGCHRQGIMEYSSTLLNHLIRLEEDPDVVRPNLPNFKSQPQINEKMRYLIVDFVMCCHERLKLSTSTLFLTLEITNRYASKFVVKCANFQLLVLTALWISSKFWDSKYRIPNFSILTSLCCQQYTPQQFEDMEWHILTSLDWAILSAPTCDSFINLLLTLTDHSKNINIAINHGIDNVDELNQGALLLCELAAFDENLSFNYNSSAVALAAITVTGLALNFNDNNQWENYHVSSTDINLNKICDFLLKLIKNEKNLPSSFKFKYLNSQSSKGSTGRKLLNVISNYNAKLQLDDYYRLQELEKLSEPIYGQSDFDENIMDTKSNNNNYDMHTNKEIMAKDQDSYFFVRNQGKNPDQINNNNNNKRSATTPGFSTTSSAFASPKDLFNLNSYGSTLVNDFEKETSLFLSNFIVPLTPTTPSILQNDSKFNNNKKRDVFKSSSNPNIGNCRFSRASSNLSFTSTANTTNTAQNTFVKKHTKRSSSIMDIDFFESEMEIKRTDTGI